MDSMTNDLDRIRLELLAEYEREGTVDIAEWVSKHTEYREELLDYWIWVRGTTRLDEIGEPPPAPADDVAETALRRAIEAIALGSSWLEDAVPDPMDAGELEELGDALAAVRRKPYRFGGKAKEPFRRSAVYAWIAISLHEERSRVTRFATQKVAYLMEQGLNPGLFRDHRPMPLGPYDSAAKYRDAEPIAVKQGWLTVVGAELRPGNQGSKTFEFARRYVRRADIAREMIRLLGQLSDDELETLATVDWTARSLATASRELTPDAVRQALGRHPEWRPKLRKPNFTIPAIRQALSWLERLRLLEPGDRGN
jgi:hypothetical protein